MSQSRSFVLIANPAAGRGRAVDILARAQELLRAAGCEATAELTTSIEHAQILASDATRVGRIAVAVGGDGVVRAVAAGAAQHGGTIGIVPAGRGNDFARTVGITKDVDGAVRVLLEAQPSPTDCLQVDGQIVIGSVYLGFDSLSNVLANELRWNLGRFSYIYAALKVVWSMPTLRITLTVDGRERTFDGIGVTVASSVYYGGAVAIAPPADPHDGLLDVITFEQSRRGARVPALWALQRGRHLARTDVSHELASTVHVRVTPTVEAYADGDPVTTAPYTVRVLPGVITLLRPS